MAEENLAPVPPNSLEDSKCCKEKSTAENSPTNTDYTASAPTGSTMRSEYLPPCSYQTAKKKDIAKRRALFRAKVVEEMIEEINREREIKDPVEDYCTTYDDMFSIPGFKLPEKPVYDEELHLKHPLYRSSPITYWTDKIDTHTKDKARLPGMTKIRDLKNPFKKNGEFTTPVHLRLDNPEC